MARTITTPIQKRFSDVDIFLHVNNVAQQMYFDVGKTEYYRAVLGEDVLSGSLRVVMVSSKSDYISQIRFSDEVLVSTTCERVGNKSLTLHQQMYVGERLCSENRSVMAVFDFDQQKSVPLPDEWRTKLTAQ